MTVGERIKAKRLEKQLTQKRLGELCGIAEPTIRRYEAGKLNPKIATIKKIADGLGVDPYELLGAEWFDMQIGKERLQELQNGIEQHKSIEPFLKSLGYFVNTATSTDGESSIVTLYKGRKEIVFSGTEYEAFVSEIVKYVEYLISKQQENQAKK